MAVTAVITVAVALTGDVVGSLSIPTQTLSASPAERLVVALANGANTLTPPTGTLAAVFVPPSNSSVTKTLKGVSGDTGLPLATNAPTYVSLAASPGAFVIAANGAENLTVYWL